MEEGRWTTVTPSQFQHEREALEHVRRLLPEGGPFRAWSNFTFTADTGHVREVDLLVAAPSGLYLIEIKSLHGTLSARGSNWVLTSPKGTTRILDNPLHLADSKAKQLKTLLNREVARRGTERIRFIQAAVFLSVPSLKVRLPDHHLHFVYGPENQTDLDKIWSNLLESPPADEGRRIKPALSRQLGALLEGVGIARSRRHLQVGAWELEARPFDTGPTWQDHNARHKDLHAERRRIRIYLVERNADQAMRAGIERAAKREMLALHGISHPGIVRVDTLEPHEAGPALIFRHDPRAQRLDHYLAQYHDRLDLDARLDMVRQLAEAIAYAHGRHLHHRSLSARSVFARPAKGRGEQGWLRPRLEISDWQSATRGPDTEGGSGDAVKVSSTSDEGRHLEASAQVYLAPELVAPSPDPVALDVFGLGSLTYLIFTGKPPAGSRAELLTRLSGENGLHPAAEADSVTEFMDELVQAATAPVPNQRLTGAAEFLELLETVEEEATAPDPVHPRDTESDPLAARAGEIVGGEWRIEKRLGTGSTSRAFLATNLQSGRPEVLKIALSDEKAAGLEREASVLRELTDSRVIHLARPSTITIGTRTALVLDHAGEYTVARKIREDGRLTPDELETYSEYLFGAVDFLEGEGITHRDIKPDNIAIRVRPNRTRQLVLFDFSLAGISVQEIEAGTPRYLDPFLGTARRQVYDAHAERYAVAVTLHEMASGELPVWGDDKTEPRLSEGPPTLATEAFDPAIRDGLADFFQQALHRDHRHRFESLKDMRDAWRGVFRRSDDLRPVGTDQGELPEDETTPEEARDAAALEATRATVLEVAGLTARAWSAAHRLDATTVGDLLDLPSKSLFNLPGLGAKTRRELQQRVREWRARLGEIEPRPIVPRPGAPEPEACAGIGLDAIAALLVPGLQKNKRNVSEVEAVRLLLGLPDESGTPPEPPAWPPLAVVEARLRSPGTPDRVAKILLKQRTRWKGEPVVQSVRDEIVALLGQGGRVMGVTELADALLTRRGSGRSAPALRRAVALAAVRAAVEIDEVMDEPRLLLRRHADRLLVALEVSEDESPDTPAAPALLDYADALGEVADRLAAAEVLPTSAAVLRDLRAALMEGGAEAALDDRRLVQLAAVASEHAAATTRLEIYPRDLPPVRALRLAQAGVVPLDAHDGRPVGLTPKQIQDKTAARFPALKPLPGHPALGTLLREAGFDVRWDRGRYVSPQPPGSSTGTLLRRRSTRNGVSSWTASSPELADALRAEERLHSAAAGGFRAVTVSLGVYERARRELVARLGATPVNVAALFLESMHELVDATPLPTWETVLEADLAPAGSRDAVKLAEYVSAAWPLTAARLAGAREGLMRPVLLHDAAPMARYEAMDVLHGLAVRARAGGAAVWVLCPQDDAARKPKLDGAIVPAELPNEWIALPDFWVANRHRSGAQAS